jgi:methionyl-tRNA formyltransferase
MRVVMMGTGTFAEPTFQALLASPHTVAGLVTQPDRATGQERGSTRQTGPSLKSIAQAHQVPVFQPDNVNTPDGVAGVQVFRPDLLVVAAYGQILSREVLAVAPQGGINVHASLLPHYRGAAPIAWAIYHGETQTGVTIIKMSIYLDAGDIVAQEVVAIGPDETAGELESRLAPLGGRLALEVIDRIAAGTVRGAKQDKSLVTKAPKLTKGHGLIDWTRPARAVCNQIRAMQPWPTAYTFLHHPGDPPTRLLILKATGHDTIGPGQWTPGEVILAPNPNQVLRVAAGPNAEGAATAVDVLELQPAGKRRMPAAEFLRGHPLQAGDHCGAEAPGS